MGSSGPEQSQQQHGATCAERVRHRHLDATPAEGDVPAEMLHTVAMEIADECGHSLFKAHRLAWGWTIPEAVKAFHTMCRIEKIKPRGLVARSWLEWEAGGRPSWDYQDLLSRLFSANPIQLGWASDYSPPELDLIHADAPYPRTSGTSIAPMRVTPQQTVQALLQLPPDIDDFTGRQEQADKVVYLLTSERSRSTTAVAIAAISGAPGVGKTALALHVAHDIAGRFPDGQMYTNLRGAEADPLEPAEALAGFLRELGVDSADIPERTDDRARLFRTRLAGRQMLVVLDNAADEAQVRPLLPGTPDCAVLVTSRSSMSALAGSHAVPLEVMPSGQAVDLLTTILGQDRAAVEPAAVTEIAELCGRLPLAIRIAGARLLSRPARRIAWFADRLRDESRRLDLLKAGDLEVRASFALSYEGQAPAGKQAFRMAGVMAADFPAWNLAALLELGADDAEELLEGLVDAQLVEVVGVDATGLIRYGLHDLLRDFARECLTKAEPEAVRREALSRLAEHYIRCARIGSALLQPGSAEPGQESDGPLAQAVVQDDPGNWFSAERANLISMVQQVHAAELWGQTWQLAQALSVMFSWRADWRAWEQTHQFALEGARLSGDDRAQAEVQCSLGLLYRELGQYDQAVAMLTNASENFRRLGDEHQWATALRNLGDTYRYQGLLEEALKAFATALAVFQNVHDQRSVAAALNGMADAHRGLSQWDEAERAFGRCIAMYRDLNDKLEKTRSTVRFAMVFRDRDLHDRAEPLFWEALEAFRALGDRRWEARTVRHLGVLHRQRDRADLALGLFSESLVIFEELADRRGIAVTLRNRGDTHRRAGAHDDAERDLTMALGIFDELHDRRWSARSHLSIAGMRRLQCRWDEGQRHAHAALEVFRTIRDRPAQARALRELGLLLRDRGDLDEAEAMLTDSLTLFRSLDDELWIARLLASQARLDELRGDDPADRYKAAFEICGRNEVAEDKIDLVLREW